MTGFTSPDASPGLGGSAGARFFLGYGFTCDPITPRRLLTRSAGTSGHTLCPRVEGGDEALDEREVDQRNEALNENRPEDTPPSWPTTRITEVGTDAALA